MKYEVQVDKSHYHFLSYTNTDRWISYYYQIREILSSGCQSILYVGKGDGLVCEAVRCIEKFSGGGIQVTTFDFDAELYPDITGDLTDISKLLAGKTYDCVVCCEILEHLPFEQLEPVLRQVRKICEKRVIISLPNRMMHFRWQVAAPKIRWKGMVSVLRFWEKEIKFQGEHYWEVGTKVYTKRKLLDIFQNYFVLVKHYDVVENPAHWFVILDADRGRTAELR